MKYTINQNNASENNGQAIDKSKGFGHFFDGMNKDSIAAVIKNMRLCTDLESVGIPTMSVLDTERNLITWNINTKKLTCVILHPDRTVEEKEFYSFELAFTLGIANGKITFYNDSQLILFDADGKQSDGRPNITLTCKIRDNNTGNIYDYPESLTVYGNLIVVGVDKVKSCFRSLTPEELETIRQNSAACGCNFTL